MADPDIDADFEAKDYQKMVETDTVIEIAAYADTPVGFFSVYHYDLEMALDEILKEIEDDIY